MPKPKGKSKKIGITIDTDKINEVFDERGNQIIIS